MKRNQFPGRCSACGNYLDAEEGWLSRKDDAGNWQIRCGSCPSASIRPTSPPRQDPAEAWMAADPIYRQLQTMLERRRAVLAQQRAILGPLRILGLEPPVTVDEVKAAYRRRSLVAHPDCGGSSQAFIQLQGAYERVLEVVGREAIR